MSDMEVDMKYQPCKTVGACGRNTTRKVSRARVRLVDRVQLQDTMSPPLH